MSQPPLPHSNVAAPRSDAAPESGIARKPRAPAADPSLFQSVKKTMLNIYARMNKHRLMTIAAGVTFYSLLAIFPALAALIAVYGLFADPATITSQLNSVADVLPSGAVDVLREEMTRLSRQHSGLGIALVIGLLISLWSTNSGTKSIFDALNVVYNEDEKRSFIKLNLISLAFTCAGIVFMILALAATVVVPRIIQLLALPRTIDIAISYLRWPILLIVVMLGLAFIFRFGPSRKGARWRWITWGSASATVAWLIISLLFTWYAAHFGSFNKTYGSLGAIIGFMTWIWLSMIVILLGAELDAELDEQNERRSIRATGD